jgi:Uma2 family endonuclease
MVIDSSTTETMVTTSSTNDVASSKRTSSNKLDKFETDYIKERNKPMPSKLHARIQTKLIVLLSSLYSNKYDIFSELSLDLLSKRATPDVCLYETQTLDFSSDEVRVNIPPKLAIEILSPKQNIDEIKTKYRDIYLPADIKSVWLIIPELKIVALGLPDGQFEVVKTDIVKDMYLDIELPIVDIFN